MTRIHLRSSQTALIVGALAAACAPRGVPPQGAAGEPLRGTAATSPAAAGEDYLVVVVSEAADRLAVVRFSPACARESAAGSGPSAPGACARVEREVAIGLMPADVDGPHGVGVSPDGRFYYVTTGHGTPFGSLWKFAAATDSLVGRVQLGMFPATLQVSPDGEFIYVVNFNLHGDMVPSSVSVVAAEPLVEVARITTCVMPHGSRINAEGTRQYSACMMDDMLVEIDTRTLAVSRHFMLAQGREHGMAGSPRAGHAAGGHAMHPSAPSGASCSPTWAQPSADGAKIYVACNKANDIVEVDAVSWTATRRIPAGDGVYNLAVTRDGRLLIATNKRGQSVSVFDLATGRELARVPTKRRFVHGAVVSPDDRYAFISVEGFGSEPGTVEVIDLATLRSVATVDLAQQAAGIDFWRTEPPSPSTAR